jgi:CRP-like cAMP-binding protein
MATSGAPGAKEQIENRILRSLTAAEYGEVMPHLELMRFPMGRIVHEPGQPMDHVYFPNHGVLSMLTVLENGDVVEIATVGNEGMADLSVFLGLDVAQSRLLVQIPGDTLRMETQVFRDLVGRLDGLRISLGHFMVAMFTLVSQSAACNRLHPVEERAARWLLMTHDRVDSNSFPITHEFLASMLGVRRPSVTVAAGMLQKAGLIRYSRGRLTVLDRAGLEEASCECYAIVRENFDAMPGAEGDISGRRRLSSGLQATTPPDAVFPTKAHENVASRVAAYRAPMSARGQMAPLKAQMVGNKVSYPPIGEGCHR